MVKQPLYKDLWIRLIISFVLLLLIAFCVGVIYWGSNSSSTDIALALLAGISALVGIGQWLFPTSSEKSNQLRLPYARQLVRESASFRMGDTSAANFDFIIEPVMKAYDIAKRVLRESSDGVGPKHGILILGAANVGKTRLALEALIQTLPDWNVFLWNSTYDSLSKVPLLTISRRAGLAIFIDDLQEYVPPENYNTDGSVFIPDNRITTLQAFLNNMLMTQHLVIVATCRLEDEIRVGARLRWLFEQLEIITLRNFRVEISNSETANIINLFQQRGSAHIKDWDGTLGSLVLGLSKKRSQYEDLVQSHNPAVILLRVMKLLSFAFITAHTTVRIQGVCTDVFGESTLHEGSKTWQDAIGLLIRLEFLSEVKDQNNGGYVLVIRKDAYFDKVIIDYPATNRPYQLDQHFEQLQKVLVRLHDISALVSLANMFSFLKRYDEALVTVEEAIRLDPNYAVAYNDKGVILSILKRYDEALIFYEEAFRLDSTSAHIYSNKGNALVNLKRYDEALIACEQAIRLDPNYAAAYLGKGSAFGILKRYEEALVAFEQAIRLDPNYAAAYNNKASVLASLNLHEEALTACEKAIRLDPNYAAPYIGKGNILSEFKRYEEALVAYEQAIRLDPNFAGTYINKGSTLSTLGRYEEALAAYGQAIRLDPTDARAFSGKGDVLSSLKRYEEALTVFEEAIRLDPNYVASHTDKVNVLNELKQYEEALAACEEAIRLDPNYSAAYTNKGVTLANLKRYDEALVAFEQAICLDPTDIRPLNNKGVILANLKRYEEALATYEQIIHLDSNYANVYINKGATLANLKQYEEALAACEEAIRLDPNFANAVVYSNKGSLLNELKRYDEALVACEEAIRLDPNSADAYNGKGNILANFKRYDEALVAYEEAIRLDPNFAGTYINKGSTLSTLGRYEEALAAYGQAIRLDPTDARAFSGIRKIFKVRGYEIELFRTFHVGD